MINFKTLSLAAAVTVVGAVSANAAVFDFGDIAETLGEGAWDTVTGGSVSDAGISVSASSSNSDLVDISVAYLDDNSGSGREAGLGVCSTGINISGDCVVASDDNIAEIDSGYETLYLNFSTSVMLTDLLLRDDDHFDLVAGDDIWLSSNSYTGFYTVGASDLADWGRSTEWRFEFGSAASGANFYVGSISVAPVPLPAAGLMLLTALGGVAATRRRKA